MNITLSPDTERPIQERVQKSEYPNVSELVNVTVHRLLTAVEHPIRQERNGQNSSALALEPLPSLKGSLPPNGRMTPTDGSR